jgi:hypothetical protein
MLVCFVQFGAVTWLKIGFKAGTLRKATINPNLPPCLLLSAPMQRGVEPREVHKPGANTSRRRVESNEKSRSTNNEFDECDLDDEDFVHAAENLAVESIDDFSDGNDMEFSHTAAASAKGNEWNPKQLPNGNWACNHVCKNKQMCKHLCCRDGLDRPPRKPARKGAMLQSSISKNQNTHLKCKGNKKDGKFEKKQTKPCPQPANDTEISGVNTADKIEELDLTQDQVQEADTFFKALEASNLNNPHNHINRESTVLEYRTSDRRSTYDCYSGQKGDPSLTQGYATQSKSADCDNTWTYGTHSSNTFGDRDALNINAEDNNIQCNEELVRPQLNTRPDGYSDAAWASNLLDKAHELCENFEAPEARSDNSDNCMGADTPFDNELTLQACNDEVATTSYQQNREPSPVEQPLFVTGHTSSTREVHEECASEHLASESVSPPMHFARSTALLSNIDNCQHDRATDAKDHEGEEYSRSSNMAVLEGFEDIDPWLLAEYGGLIEIV